MENYTGKLYLVGLDFMERKRHLGRGHAIKVAVYGCIMAVELNKKDFDFEIGERGNELTVDS